MSVATASPWWTAPSGFDRLSDRNRVDYARFARRLALGQRVDIFHAFDHIAPDGVLAVKEGRIVKDYEELAVCTIRILRAGHRAGAANMGLVVEFLAKVGLGRTAHAGTIRAATLRHETVNDAMEFHAIVKAFARQFDNACDMVGGKVRTQLDHNIAGRKVHGECFGHLGILFVETLPPQ